MKTFDVKKIRLVAMDLDGTLTQHKSPLTPENRAALDALGRRYKLLMVGAGQVMRIFTQMDYPIDVIGNYGMQYGTYDTASHTQILRRDLVLPCDREEIRARVERLRQKYGFTQYRGESVEFHPSGCVTFAILGTKALQEDKLAFDPDRKKRRAIYDEVCAAFPEYRVFVGGSSSFDMAPEPYDKYYALDLYCKENGLSHDQVVYIGDDYGLGGNDEAVYKSDFPYLTIDDYRTFPQVVKILLSEGEEKKMNYWKQSNKNVYVAGHRGWPRKYPENTMISFKGALQLGVDQIETDVRITKDGELVLIHDAAVDRTTDGTGEVRDFTFEELQRLDAGSWKDPAFAGARIPKLRDLFELVKDHPTITLDLELKEYPDRDEDGGWEKVAFEVCDRTVAMVEEYHFEDRVVLNTFSTPLMNYVHKKYPQYRTHVFFPMFKMRGEGEDPYPGAYCACVYGPKEVAEGIVTSEEICRFALETGIRVWAGCYANTPETVEMALSWGAELITANNPDEIMQILWKKGLRP